MAQPFAQPCDRGLIEAEPCPRERGREITNARKRMVLTACVLASSMAFIDGSALTVALPRLRAFFGADLAAVQWVLNGYVLALAALTLIGGALADVYGKARMLVLGCLGFGAASAACIFAPSVEWLILLRVAQGRVGRAADAGQSRADRRHLSERRAQRRDRRVGGGLRAHHCRWPGAGRLADARFRLAVRVRDQSAAGADRGGVAGRVRAGRPARAKTLRSLRCGDPCRRAGGAGLGAGRDRTA